MMPSAISVKNLTRRFGDFVAVDDVSFDVAEGEIFGFLGANGAGKSTTIRMLCGLLRPTSGTAVVGGVDVSRDPEAVKLRIGYMSQKFSLYRALTVDQNIRFFGGVYGLEGKRYEERRRFALEMAGLVGRETAMTRDLAGGWRQRLALGCAILHEPPIVFLDEPTGGVDPVSRRQFWRLIDRLSQEGTTVLVTTHYLDEAEHCHRIAVMSAGRLAALGTTAELKHVFDGRAIVEVQARDAVAAMRELEQMPEVEKTSLFGTAVHAVLRDVTLTPEQVAERPARERRHRSARRSRRALSRGRLPRRRGTERAMRKISRGRPQGVPADPPRSPDLDDPAVHSGVLPAAVRLCAEFRHPAHPDRRRGSRLLAGEPPSGLGLRQLDLLRPGRVGHERGRGQRSDGPRPASARR